MCGVYVCSEPFEVMVGITFLCYDIAQNKKKWLYLFCLVSYLSKKMHNHHSCGNYQNINYYVPDEWKMSRAENDAYWGSTDTAPKELDNFFDEDVSKNALIQLRMSILELLTGFWSFEAHWRFYNSLRNIFWLSIFSEFWINNQKNGVFSDLGRI